MAMATTFDRKVFFDAVRRQPFGGSMSQQQVDGMDIILNQWEHQALSSDLRWLAYMFATTFHETARTMWPISEYGKGAGHDYGEKDPETGQTYYGRGFVQLTWRDNYARATDKLGLIGNRDIEWHADMALDLEIASNVMFRGMAEGWFTGKRLDQYFSETADDPVNARAIINNDVSKMGKTIAGYHQNFLDALDAAVIEEVLPPEPGFDVVHVNIQAPPGISVSVAINGEIIVAGPG